MRIGLMLEGQAGVTWDYWQRFLQLAEDLNYDSLFRSDHFAFASPPDKASLELWVSLTYAASHTQRIEFGPMVTPVTFRPPVVTAWMAAQVDALSEGRLVLGMGAGWNELEHTMFGIPFYDTKTRMDMFAEALELTTRLFKDEEPVTYQGKHFTLENATLLQPHRPGGPRVLVGGSGPTRTMPLAARYAVEWNMFGSVTRFKERSALLDELLEKEGRQPGDVQRSISTNTTFGKTDADLKARLDAKGVTVEAAWERGMTVGTASQMIDRFGEWQEAGVDRLLLQWLDLDDTESIEMIARDVLPHFHKG